MSILTTVNEEILKKLQEHDLPITEISLIPNSRKDLGDYQINDAMKLAKIMHKSPREIATNIADALEETNYFENINIAGAGCVKF